MVAWRVVMATPEYPKGREMILIANDLTFLIGSFGPREDQLFNKASILARERKVPRVSANHNPRRNWRRELNLDFGFV